MPVKIRLQRHGKKGKPFYWIVAADSRAKRDGKYLEKLGIYNPNTNPATIEVNVDNSVEWLNNGAQPTDTARAILSYKGVLLKHHLLGGVRKGALTEEQAEEKFVAWLAEKEKLVASKVSGLDKAKADAKAKALAAEKEVNEKRALAAAEAELPEEIVESEIVVEETAEEAPVSALDAAVAEAKGEVAAPKEVVEKAPKEEAAPEAEASKEEE
jgi:small subunit ribosomal protein S16